MLPVARSHICYQLIKQDKYINYKGNDISSLVSRDRMGECPLLQPKVLYYSSASDTSQRSTNPIIFLSTCRKEYHTWNRQTRGVKAAALISSRVLFCQAIFYPIHLKVRKQAQPLSFLPSLLFFFFCRFSLSRDSDLNACLIALCPRLMPPALP